jgi:hypothetical protein
MQRSVEGEVNALNLAAEVLAGILDLVSSNLKAEDAEDAAPAEDFEDLGKSARLKSIEDSFRKLDSNSEKVDLCSIGLPSLESFEQRMLHFVRQIN